MISGVPTTNDASSKTRNSAARAISVGSPMRPMGVASSTSRVASGISSCGHAVPHQRCVRAARCDGIDANIVPDQIKADRACEAENTRFRRAIGDAARKGREPKHGGNIDNCPTPRARIAGTTARVQKEHAFQVDRQNAVPLRFIEFHQPPGAAVGVMYRWSSVGVRMYHVERDAQRSCHSCGSPKLVIHCPLPLGVITSASSPAAAISARARCTRSSYSAWDNDSSSG